MWGKMKKQLLVLIAVIAVLFGGFGIVNATGNDKEVKEDKKVYVCKYVGKPGLDERLQTGNNPIHVSVNSIKLTPPDTEVSVGDEFADAQGRSVVVADGATCVPAIADNCPVPKVVINERCVDKPKDPETPGKEEPKTPTPVVEPTPTTPVDEPVVEEFQGK